jgi:hypothetical protein
VEDRTVPRLPFADLPPTPAQHFRLYYFGAVLHLLEQLSLALGSRAAAPEQFPFLAGYEAELAGLGLEGLGPAKASAWWQAALEAWESAAAGHLPLRALRAAAGLDHDALTLLLTTGLLEEDARFGLVFEAAQAAPGHHRPTLGLLSAWWRDALDGGARARVRRLQELGLVQVTNPDAPRLEWALHPPGPVWDALRGEAAEAPAPGMRYRPAETLPDLDDLIVPDAVRQALARLPGLLGVAEVSAVVVRGPRHNGRRTALGAVARRLGRGVLEVHGPAGTDDERWKLVGPLATLLHALPVAVLDLAPGETAHLPRLGGYDGPLGLVLGRQGGVGGPGVERALTLALDMPDPAARRLHWSQGLGGAAGPDLGEISRRFRMTGGHIRRAAGLARAHAALAGRPAVTLADVRQAGGALSRQSLDTLATRLTPSGDWGHLAVAAETLRELADLEGRCRHREALPAAVGPALAAQLTPGVRALFTGPSGTGKTLAARLLAAALQMDLYRLDLAAVVNKYIGETEKSLNQVFALAEELDVILLLDEGDALMTQRTAVQTANDRYANLETNYLLQRLETYEGILIVTTNAPERIDGAFRRRMDVVVDFAPPGPPERWAICRLHLPAAHAVDAALLHEVAARCTLTGAQLRNAVLHASLLALEDGGALDSGHLEEAIRREYRKVGGICPLRHTAGGTTGRG